MSRRFALYLCLILGLTALTAGHAAGRRVFYRAASGAWQPLPSQYDAATSVLRFTVDPAQGAGGVTSVVIDPPAGIRLDDDQPPRFTGLTLDGRAYPTPKSTLDLDWLPAHPDTIVVRAEDAANPLDLASLRVTLNGKALRPTAVKTAASGDGKAATITLHLSRLLRREGQFRNEVVVRIADASPQRNEASLTLRYCCLQDLKGAPAVLTDSALEGYQDLKLLTDGVIMEPGVTTFGVTWASLEEPGDHWVVLAWPTEQTFRDVEVFWAAYSGTYWGPVKLLVQTWDGQKWTTQQTVTRTQPERSTKVDLGGLRTSRLRLIQPDGQGNPARPNIMWITEIKWE
jgi:hypothetical protein